MSLIEMVLSTAIRARPFTDVLSDHGDFIRWDSIKDFRDLSNANMIIELSYPGVSYQTLLDLNDMLTTGSYSFLVMLDSDVVDGVIRAVTPKAVEHYIINCSDFNTCVQKSIKAIGPAATERSINNLPIVDILIFFDLNERSEKNQVIVDLAKKLKPEFVMIID